MERFVWDEKFEWIENTPVTDAERSNLSVDDIIKREMVFSKYMAKYKGRWIIVKDQIVLASGETLNDVANRPLVENADDVRHLPVEKSYGFFYLADAA